MNAYRIRFFKTCPVDGAAICYTLAIVSKTTIMAEHIERAVAALPDPVFHEVAADELAAALPGRQTMTAKHGVVEIRTVRGS